MSSAGKVGHRAGAVRQRTKIRSTRGPALRAIFEGKMAPSKPRTAGAAQAKNKAVAGRLTHPLNAVGEPMGLIPIHPRFSQGNDRAESGVFRAPMPRLGRAKKYPSPAAVSLVGTYDRSIGNRSTASAAVVGACRQDHTRVPGQTWRGGQRLSLASSHPTKDNHEQ